MHSKKVKRIALVSCAEVSLEVRIDDRDVVHFTSHRISVGLVVVGPFEDIELAAIVGRVLFVHEVKEAHLLEHGWRQMFFEELLKFLLRFGFFWFNRCLCSFLCQWNCILG